MAGSGRASRDLERPLVQRLGLHKLSLGTGVFGGEEYLGLENDRQGFWLLGYGVMCHVDIRCCQLMPVV